jgi:hypothetical protein
MIFYPPRFAVIDDNNIHITAITDTIKACGSYCIGFHFNPEERDFGIDKNLLREVRCLFVDMHLMAGTTLPSSGDNSAYALISNILQQNIDRDGGPYVLVLWTEYPQMAAELRQYIDSPDAFPDDMYYAKPVDILALSKSDYIDTISGSMRNPDNLKEAITNELSSLSSFSAVLAWENDVLNAAKYTINSLVDLIPKTDKTQKYFSEQLGLLLTRLASAAVGASNVSNDPRAAMYKALSPLLYDRIATKRTPLQFQKFWSDVFALASSKLPRLDEKSAGQINGMLHLATPAHETIKPSDWGAVCNWPFPLTGRMLKTRTGLSRTEMFCSEFGIKEPDISRCTPILVRVGAACDFAQNKPGGNTFLFGTAVPADIKKTKKLSDAIWESPLFIDAGKAAFRLYIHMRYPMTLSLKQQNKLQANFRLREQLLMELITKASHHAARPGIMQLSV